MRASEVTANRLAAQRAAFDDMLGRLARVDDGLVRLSRREIVARLRALVDAQRRADERSLLAAAPGDDLLLCVRRYNAGIGRLERALDDLEVTSPRHAGYEGAVAEAREAVAELFATALEPLSEIARRRAHRAASDERATTAPLELPRAA
jgi:hypothetical protein